MDVVFLFVPGALLEQHDLEARAAEFERERGAARPGTHDADVDWFECHQQPLPPPQVSWCKRWLPSYGAFGSPFTLRPTSWKPTVFQPPSPLLPP